MIRTAQRSSRRVLSRVFLSTVAAGGLVSAGFLGSVFGAGGPEPEERPAAETTEVAALPPDTVDPLPAQVRRRGIPRDTVDLVNAAAARLKIDPDHLFAVLSFETGGSFSPAVRNPRSGATGLIQFTARTAEALGVTTDELAAMTAAEQLAYVEKHLAATRLSSLAKPRLSDVYMAVFAPSLVGRPESTPAYAKESDGLKYTQNAELDLDGDGVITKAEAAHAVTRHWHGPDKLADLGEGFFDVYVNGQPHGPFVYIEVDAEGRAYMAVEDFAGFGFAAEIEPVVIDGRTLIPLSGHDDFDFTFTPEGDAVFLDVGPAWFADTHINLRRRNAGTPSDGVPGGYVNYVMQGAFHDRDLSSLGFAPTLALFGKWGYFESSFASTMDFHGSSEFTWRRLVTRYIRDFPERRATLTVGDSVSYGGPGAPALRFGGVTYESDFDLDPYFSIYQWPTFTTGARLPSTIEFMIDDRRVGGPVSVPAGPVTIDGLPTVDGEGQVRVIVRDALGNEQEMLIPFFQARDMYRQGVHHFSYSAGLLREDENVYSTPYASTAHRYGLTDRLTVEASAAATTDGVTLGGGFMTPVGNMLLAEMNAGASLSHGGLGYRLGGSVSPLVRGYSFGWGVSASHSSESYDLSLGGDFGKDAPRNELRVYASHGLQNWGSLTGSLGYLDRWDGSTRSIATLNWSKSFSRMYASLGATYSEGDAAVRASLSFRLGPRDTVRGGIEYDEEGVRSAAQYDRQLPTDYGIGYSVQAVHDSGHAGDIPEVSGRLLGRSRYGDHFADLRYYDDGLSGSMGTAGSLGVADGTWFATAPIRSGLAVVRTGAATGIPVYRDNNPVATTDGRGVAVIPGLRPYERNRLNVKAEEVPFEFTIANTEADVVPATRGAVSIDFEMLRLKPAVLILTTPDGEFLPSGTRLVVVETETEAFVALRGEAYVEDLPENSTIRLEDGDASCEITIENPDTDDPQPRLGPFVCDLG